MCVLKPHTQFDTVWFVCVCLWVGVCGWVGVDKWGSNASSRLSHKMSWAMVPKKVLAQFSVSLMCERNNDETLITLQYHPAK